MYDFGCISYEPTKSMHTGKSLSEALISASTNPQYDDRLFIELHFHRWNFQAQIWGKHVVYRNCFRPSEQFLYTTCSGKRRASKKDLPVLPEIEKECIISVSSTSTTVVILSKVYSYLIMHCP